MLGSSLGIDIAQCRLERMHATGQAPAVYFELGLARSPSADARALLRQCATLAAQSWQPIFQLGQLDLGFAFNRAGVLGKNVQNDRCPVQRGSSEQFLQIELLRRRQLVVGHVARRCRE